MNGMRALLERYWVTKDTDKTLFYQVKHELPAFDSLIRERLGWKLIQTEKLLKLEKIPAHAMPFMGITEFSEIRDYCILCALLIFLEDREEGEQFLLSELLDNISIYLKRTIGVDWNSFSQRKSLVRVLQYAQQLGMLRVYDGSSEAIGQSIGNEVLYENTGISRYFATNFPYEITEYQSWKDFEKEATEELMTDRGFLRINRVYRQMVVCPAMYWERNDDPDAIYLKNQRKWVSKYLTEALGGQLDIYKNAAFWMLDESDTCGSVHPRDAMLPELALMMGSYIRTQVEQGVWAVDSTDCICISHEDFLALFQKFHQDDLDAWSKEYREMDAQKAYEAVKTYMRSWMMLEEQESGIRIYPGAVKCTGFYPPDYSQTRGDRDEQSLENESDGVRELLAL